MLCAVQTSFDNGVFLPLSTWQSAYTDDIRVNRNGICSVPYWCEPRIFSFFCCCASYESTWIIWLRLCIWPHSEILTRIEVLRKLIRITIKINGARRHVLEELSFVCMLEKNDCFPLLPPPFVSWCSSVASIGLHVRLHVLSIRLIDLR